MANVERHRGYATLLGFASEPRFNGWNYLVPYFGCLASNAAGFVGGSSQVTLGMAAFLADVGCFGPWVLDFRSFELEG